jgi:surface antigen
MEFPVHAPLSRRLIAALIVTAVAASALVLVAIAPASASTNQLCEGYVGCSVAPYSTDGYAAIAKTGASYWGADPGVNCTNYAAYIEQTVFGVAAVAGLGNGGDWARNAATFGIPVDGLPSVGAVAEWDNGGSMGALGHVAIVEAVGPNYIDISQDNVSSGGADRFEWRRITRASAGGQTWPDNFIHFAVTRSGALNTPAPHEISATVNPFNGTQSAFFNDQGTLTEEFQDANGWHTASPLPNSDVTGSISAVVSPVTGYFRVFYDDGGVLNEDYSDAAGWHSASLPSNGVSGAVSADVNPLTGYSSVFFDNDGILQYDFEDGAGWHSAALPANAVTGDISSVVDPATGHLRVLYNGRGVLEEDYSDAAGWHSGTLPAGSVTGAISASIDTATGFISVAFANADTLEVDTFDTVSWHNSALPGGIPTGAINAIVSSTTGQTSVFFDSNGDLVRNDRRDRDRRGSMERDGGALLQQLPTAPAQRAVVGRLRRRHCVALPHGDRVGKLPAEHP